MIITLHKGEKVSEIEEFDIDWNYPFSPLYIIYKGKIFVHLNGHDYYPMQTILTYEIKEEGK